MNFFLSVVVFTSLFCVSFAGYAWQENTFLASGRTCSKDERVKEFAATLDECKAEAIVLESIYIYFQDTSIRDEEYCHIYTSCDYTRYPALGGTNYEYFECIDNDGNGCDVCLGQSGECKGTYKTYSECKEVEVDGAYWCGAISDCIDNDGNACDGCLGKSGNCNSQTYEKCDMNSVGGWLDNAYWCG